MAGFVVATCSIWKGVLCALDVSLQIHDSIHLKSSEIHAGYCH